MDKHTSDSGKVEAPSPNQGRLYDFDIDGAILKPEHTQFLDGLIAAARARKSVKIWLRGSTDRLGDANYNYALSERRIQAVTAYLKPRLNGVSVVFKPQPKGDALAKEAGDEEQTTDDWYRSVEVSLTDPNDPPPPPVKPKPKLQDVVILPKIPHVFPVQPHHNTSSCLGDGDVPAVQNFEIQLVAGGSGGEGFELMTFVYWIADVQNRMRVMYELRGFGAGTPSPIPISPSALGKPVPFKTSQATKVTRFGPVGGLAAGAPPLGPAGTSIPENPLIPSSFTILTFSFRDVNGSIAGSVTLPKMDHGRLPNLPGAGLHGGVFRSLTVCNGNSGAVRF